MAIDLQVADSVTASINAATLSLPVVAKRYYVPNFDLQAMQDLHVSVVPRGLSIAPVARRTLAFDPHIDVAVQKKVACGEAAELDPLRQLVDEIDGLFRMKRLPSFPAAHWIKTEYRTLYAVEHLAELRQFTSVITLTFRVLQ